MARISVVMPNRNHARELVVSLEGLARQSRPPDEIVVVDDASEDDSLAVIESFRQRLPNLRLVRNQTWLGVATSVRVGVETASGDYILPASADERLTEEACAELAGAIEAFPDTRLAVSIFTEWNAATGEVRIHDHRSAHGMWYLSGDRPEYFSPAALQRLLHRRFVWLGINTAIVQRDALLEVGVYDPALRWHGDWFATYAIALRYGFGAVPKSLAWYRNSADSYSSAGMRDASAQRRVALEIQRKLRRPEYRDVDALVMRTPIVMSMFFRPTVLALAARPRWYPRLLRLLWWFAGQVVRGRRPGALAKLVSRFEARGSRSAPRSGGAS